MQNKVYKVRANHYPANMTVEMDHLQQPIGVAVCKDILYCAESKRNAVAFIDLTRETVVDVDEKLKEKLKDMGSWSKNYKRKPKKCLQEKLREALNISANAETNSVQQMTHRCIVFDREIKQPVELCFDQDGMMYVATFTGEIFVMQLHCNLVNLKGTVKSSLQLGSKLLYGIISMNNMVYVSAHDENGGIYQISLTDDSSGSTEKIVNNGASIYNKVHRLTMYSDNVFAFSDTGDSSIKVYNL